MSKQTIWTLSILCCAGFAMLGCQSDYQKMDKGLAEKYQNRYNMCKQSLITNDFEGYVGFGFEREIGACECNGQLCEFGCRANGECAECQELEMNKKCEEDGFVQCNKGKIVKTKCYFAY